MPRKFSIPTSSSNLSLSSSPTGTPITPTFSSTPSGLSFATSAPTTPSPFPRLNLPSSICDPSIPFPRLIVFDLDYTLWPFWVDTHVTPPLKINPAHTGATDRTGEEFEFYSEVPEILAVLPYLNHPNKIKLGVASRTSAPALARELLKGIHIPPTASFAEDDGNNKKAAGKKKVSIDVFDGGLEIYPGSKIKHFEALQKRTGIRFEDMLFFDDEPRNRETERLGLTMKLVPDGVSWEEMGKGIELWRSRRFPAQQRQKDGEQA
ncbi:acid phosphatase domain-containing protein [Trichoderma sp. SZMC 28013]